MVGRGDHETILPTQKREELNMKTVEIFDDERSIVPQSLTPPHPHFSKTTESLIFDVKIV